MSRVLRTGPNILRGNDITLRSVSHPRRTCERRRDGEQGKFHLLLLPVTFYLASPPRACDIRDAAFAALARLDVSACQGRDPLRSGRVSPSSDASPSIIIRHDYHV